MADLYSTQGALQNAALTRADMRVPNGGTIFGDLKMAYGNYVMTAAEADDDIVHMVRLPKGARIIPWMSMFWSDDNLSSIDIGTGTNDDVFLAAKDASSTTKFLFNDSTGSLAQGIYTVGDDGNGGEWVSIVIETSANKTAGKFLAVMVAYLLPQ